MNYTIYPKKGKPFPLALYKFEVEPDRIAVYTDSSQNPGFLSLTGIAAIVPEKQPTPTYDPERTILSMSIYLRSHVDAPFTVLAHAYKYEKDLPEIEFYWTRVMGHPEPIKNQHLYVASSEVIALVVAANDR